MTVCELRVSPDAHAPRRARTAVIRWLDARGWPAAEAQDVVFAVNEAVSNAAEHAYRDPAAGTGESMVTVTVTELVDSGAHRVKVTVVDHGAWRPVPTSGGFRGRGLQMIRSLTQAVDVHHGERGTSVTMISHPVFEHDLPPQEIKGAARH